MLPQPAWRLTISLSQNHFQFLKIINIPWGPSVRALLAQLAAESNEESTEGGYRLEELHFGQVVNPNPPLTCRFFLQKPVQLMQHYLWTSLLSVNPTGPSGRDRGLAIGRGNAGRLSGVKASSNITRELTGATELQGRIRSCLFTFCLFVFLVFFLCALGTQSVVCKDPDRTSGPQPLTKFFGIQTTS